MIRPSQKHSKTSRAAAHEIKDSVDTLRYKVRLHIEDAGDRGATDEEIQIALGMHGNTERPRRIELLNDFHVVMDSGRTRPTKSGRQAVVWVIDHASILAQQKKPLTEQKQGVLWIL